MEIGSKPIMESMIDSKLTANGNVEEYLNKVVESSHEVGVDLNEIRSYYQRTP
jgi:hypothetical protein